MNWLKWLFCPHDWSKIVYEVDVYGPESIKYPIYRKRIYQCSKCTRFKKVKI